MEIQCKQCKSDLRVQQPDAGKDLVFECENCGCEMSLHTTLGGTSILSLVKGAQTMSNDLRVADEVVFPQGGIMNITTGMESQEPVIYKFTYDKFGYSLSKTGQIVALRKHLAELEKQERYEDCAKVRDKLNELIYSDIK